MSFSLILIHSKEKKLKKNCNNLSKRSVIMYFINFDSKNILKSEFYKNIKVSKIDHIDIYKIYVSKEEPYGAKIHLNTLLDTMIMMLLDHYV